MEVAVNEDETEPVVKPGFTENLAIMSIDSLNRMLNDRNNFIKEHK